MTAGRLLLGFIVALFIYYQVTSSPSLLESSQWKVLIFVTVAYLAYTIAPTPLVTKLFGTACAISGAYLISGNNLKFGILLVVMGIVSYWSGIDDAKVKKKKERRNVTSEGRRAPKG